MTLQLYLGLFLYGVTTFITPCSIGLVSAYLTYTLKEGENRVRGVLTGLSFMAAMGLVFFALGYAVSSLVPLNLATSKAFYIVAGALLILFGLSSLEVFQRVVLIEAALARLTEVTNRFKFEALQSLGGKGVVVRSFLFGLVISMALGPCSLALVLPAVMLTLFSAPSPAYGGLQLMAFGLGHGLPVLLLSALITQTRHMFSGRLTSIGARLTQVLGVGLIVMGVWVILSSI